MRLRHLAFDRVIDYATASRLQERVVRQFLNYKSAPRDTFPQPTVITAQFLPVYTCGRRDIGSVTVDQERFLRTEGRAEFHEAQRGGQTTFHGPGQLVAYPIIDLKQHGLSARCYVHLLEDVVMDTCKHFQIETIRTENPGVWADENRKICAVGIHLRRNISSHGIGLNVNTDLWWFKRIVACGLENKSATSMQDLGINTTVEAVTEVWIDNFVRRLAGVEGVERGSELGLSDQG